MSHETDDDEDVFMESRLLIYLTYLLLNQRKYFSWHELWQMLKKRRGEKDEREEKGDKDSLGSL